MKFVKNIKISNLQYSIENECVIKGNDIDVQHLQITHP